MSATISPMGHGLSRRAAVHRANHAAELRSALDLVEPNLGPFGNRGLVARRPVMSAAMGSLAGVIRDERTHQVIEMIAAQDDEAVQHLVLERLNGKRPMNG